MSKANAYWSSDWASQALPALCFWLTRAPASPFPTPSREEELHHEIPLLLDHGIGVEAGYHGERTFKEQELIVISPGVPSDVPQLMQARQAGHPRHRRSRTGRALPEGPHRRHHRLKRQDHHDHAHRRDHRRRRQAHARRRQHRHARHQFRWQLDRRFLDCPRSQQLSAGDHRDLPPHDRRGAERHARPSRPPPLVSRTTPRPRRASSRTRPPPTSPCSTPTTPPAPRWPRRPRLQSTGSAVSTKWSVAHSSATTAIIWRDANGEQSIMPVAEIALKGAHNVENVLAAVSAGMLAGVAPADIRRAVANFKAVEHRLEYVATISGVAYYNDSKATNVDATIKALESFPGRIHLILGGKDKGSDYTVLNPLLAERVKRVYTIGAAARKDRVADQRRLRGQRRHHRQRRAPGPRLRHRRRHRAAGPGLCQLRPVRQLRTSRTRLQRPRPPARSSRLATRNRRRAGGAR